MPIIKLVILLIGIVVVLVSPTSKAEYIEIIILLLNSNGVYLLKFIFDDRSLYSLTIIVDQKFSFDYVIRCKGSLFFRTLLRYLRYLKVYLAFLILFFCWSQMIFLLVLLYS